MELVELAELAELASTPEEFIRTADINYTTFILI